MINSKILLMTNSKILIMSSTDKPILTSKPSVTNFSRFQCFEPDFNVFRPKQFRVNNFC